MLSHTQVLPVHLGRLLNNQNIRNIPGSPNGKPWYCAKDLTAALGKRWVNASQNLSNLRKEDKWLFQITTKGGRQKTWFVSKRGAQQLLENESTARKKRLAAQGVIPSGKSCKDVGYTPGVFAENNADIIPEQPKSPSQRPPKRPTPEQIITLAKKLTPKQFEILRNRYLWRLDEAATGERQPPAKHRLLSDNPPPLSHARLLLDDVANKELRNLDSLFEVRDAA
ncbi:MAG: BRO family protein [Sedimenticola sp.]